MHNYQTANQTKTVIRKRFKTEKGIRKSCKKILNSFHRLLLSRRVMTATAARYPRCHFEFMANTNSEDQKNSENKIFAYAN